MHRNIITNYNFSWIVGHREERKTENDPWERALHSDWVYALQNSFNDPIPPANIFAIECPVGIYPIEMEPTALQPHPSTQGNQHA